nr:MAG TPA: hypothetical protein [Caudoviricetes sp.]
MPPQKLKLDASVNSRSVNALSVRTSLCLKALLVLRPLSLRVMCRRVTANTIPVVVSVVAEALVRT